MLPRGSEKAPIYAIGRDAMTTRPADRLGHEAGNARVVRVFSASGASLFGQTCEQKYAQQ